METNLISFETFQVLSFSLAASLWLFMTMAFIKWCIRSVRDKTTRPGRR